MNPTMAQEELKLHYQGELSRGAQSILPDQSLNGFPHQHEGIDSHERTNEWSPHCLNKDRQNQKCKKECHDCSTYKKTHLTNKMGFFFVHQVSYCIHMTKPKCSFFTFSLVFVVVSDYGQMEVEQPGIPFSGRTTRSADIAITSAVSSATSSSPHNEHNPPHKQESIESFNTTTGQSNVVSFYENSAMVVPVKGVTYEKQGNAWRSNWTFNGQRFRKSFSGKLTKLHWVLSWN